MSTEAIIVITIMWLLGAAGIIITEKRLIRSDRERRRAEERLMVQHYELQVINQEMEVLNKISSAISQTLDLNELLNIVLKTVTEIEILSVDPQGGIFIIDGDRMDLVAHLGHPEEFLAAHKDMKVGKCICGKAAESGEIIISANSDSHDEHSIRYNGMAPHGHVIVPLKTMNRVVGVLYLYTPYNVDIKKHKINLLQSIGSQIGIAIENSRLYEETKALSLRDHLTGLANRRLMEITLKRNFARARRYKSPLSVIMLDVDHFKQYNDTYGHAKGDEALIKVANILLKETREIDLVVRYGGEEFFIMVPDTDLAAAREAAERIRAAVESGTDVTVSLGVTSCCEGMTEGDLIGKADSALYTAKDNGRDRVEVSL